MPLGLLNASASLGPALAPLLLTPLMVYAGWRSSFIALGVVGLLVALAWAVVYRTPPQSVEATPKIAGPTVWLALLRQRSMWGLLLSFPDIVYITWLYVTWLPGGGLGHGARGSGALVVGSAIRRFRGCGRGWLAGGSAGPAAGRADGPASSAGGRATRRRCRQCGRGRRRKRLAGAWQHRGRPVLPRPGNHSRLGVGGEPRTGCTGSDSGGHGQYRRLGRGLAGDVAHRVLAEATGSFTPTLWLAAGLAAMCAGVA